MVTVSLPPATSPDGGPHTVKAGAGEPFKTLVITSEDSKQPEITIPITGKWKITIE